MLKTMRNSFHHLKWTLFVVIASSSSGSSSCPADRDPRRRRPSQVVARVGGERITAVEFDRQYQRAAGALPADVPGQLLARARTGSGPSAQRPRRDDRAEAAARSRAPLDLSVSDAELAEKIVTLPFFQDNGQFIGPRELRAAASRQRPQCPSSFEERDAARTCCSQKYGELVQGLGRRPGGGDPERVCAPRTTRPRSSTCSFPSSRLESSAAADRCRPPAVPRQAQGPLPHAGAAPRQVPPRRQGQGPREDQADRRRHRRRVREAEGRHSTVPEQVNAAHILDRRQARRRPERRRRREGEGRDRRRPRPGQGCGLREARQREYRTTRAARRTADSSRPSRAARWSPSSRRRPSPWSPGRSRGPIKTQFGYHIIKLNSKTPARHALARRGARRRCTAELSEQQATAEVERLARELAAKLTKMSSASDEDLRKLADRRRQLQHDGVGRQGRPDPGHRRRIAKFTEEAWELPIGKVSATPITTARGAAFVKPSEERAGGRAALRGAEDPPRAGLEGRAAREGRSRAARARGEGARRRSHARRTRAALRHRGQDHDRVRPGRPRSPKSAPRRSSSPRSSGRRRARPDLRSRSRRGSCSSAC